MGCAARSWALAVLGGLVIGVVVWVVSPWGFAAAATLAVLIALVVGLFLSLAVCPGSKRSSPPVSAGPSTSATSSGQAEAPASEPAAAPSKPASSAPASSKPEQSGTASATAVKPSAPLPGQAELASRKGDWKYQKDADVPASDAPARESAPAKAGPSSVSDVPAADEGEAKPRRAPVAADGKPELLDAPRPEGADDLKLISGVGPKLEQTLNELGIWHFSQVAGWRKKEIAWVDERLRFKGRIERDDWMSQAKILAKGGETEFSKKKKK
ncbi:hypothetical protein BOO69_06605 [Sulfitobacter alexandrii]|uniref:Uncharacterized protein n=2 Tax=Sulfitobacter alexandrii TaxID=1917485 RepID=A0A1J0WLU3_9RHOB|nr:hypothetical protein BOO69_06605 [Sulfitobacter alexandrii]